PGLRVSGEQTLLHFEGRTVEADPPPDSMVVGFRVPDDAVLDPDLRPCLRDEEDRSGVLLQQAVGEDQIAQVAGLYPVASDAWSEGLRAAEQAAFEGCMGAFVRDDQATAPVVRAIFAPRASDKPLTLLLKGTNFQIRVWEALLAIPAGHTTTYEALGSRLGLPRHGRAVGNAVAHNAISWLVPCHRVIRKTGIVHHYRWGGARKRAMLAWEAARSDGARGSETSDRIAV
ncbi:MAG: methylated-DNA--[protein]-cysteine S-methyltransferase, partial [Alphaproteobacteria bacterium]|nr:methylated-DNA--[protein]-cysteine S-methyltransferase [Alphaproteobacteria bacterium]